MHSYSVCMSVYRNDNADDFKTATRSIYLQTIKPEEIVLVVDGPIPNSLKDSIVELQSEISILKVIPLGKNMGHANARQIGLDAAKNELIAVMDSDDISVPNRFELQLKAFDEHPEVSVIGGLINEFIDTTDNILCTRIVPRDDKDIKMYLKSRCPMNLVTVMLKKSDVMAVGGYIDWYCEEDYFLWIRIALAGYKFYNIQENLVNVRVGKEMYRRRGGKKYFISEALLQKYMWKHKIITLPKYLYNVTGRWVVQVGIPNKLRCFIYQKLFRKS